MKSAYLVVLLLAGCAKEGSWNKPDASERDFYADRGTCAAQMQANPFSNATQQAIIFAGCMQGRGWAWVER